MQYKNIILLHLVCMSLKTVNTNDIKICDIGFSFNKNAQSNKMEIGSCFRTGTTKYYQVDKTTNKVQMNGTAAHHDDCTVDANNGFFDTGMEWSALQIDCGPNNIDCKINTKKNSFSNRITGSGYRDFLDIADCGGKDILSSTAVVDLRNVGFAVKNKVEDQTILINCNIVMDVNTETSRTCQQWTIEGFNGKMVIECTENNQLCTMKCGGSSAWCHVSKDYLELVEYPPNLTNNKNLECDIVKECEICIKNSVNVDGSGECQCDAGFDKKEDLTCGKCDVGKYKQTPSNIARYKKFVCGTSDYDYNQNKNSGEHQCAFGVSDASKLDTKPLEEMRAWFDGNLQNNAAIMADAESSHWIVKIQIAQDTSSVMVGNIRFYNSQTCCNAADSYVGFTVYVVSDNEEYDSESNKCNTEISSDYSDILCNIAGHYLIIKSEDSRALSFSEVEIYGNSNCQECGDLNSSPVENATSCACNPGYTIETEGGKCVPCPEDTYKNEYGNGLCSTCPEHSSNIGNQAQRTISSCLCKVGFEGNASNCEACSAGKFKDDINEDACVLCAIGTYSENVGETSCMICASNSTSIPGSTSADNCICQRGYSLNPTDKLNCNQCAMGHFKNVLGDQNCTKCGVGKYLPSFGATSGDQCEYCHANSNSSMGTKFQHHCTCNIGYKQSIDSLGTITCERCGVSTYKSEIGNFDCKFCEVGKYSMTLGGISINSCQSCEAGSFKSSINDIECELCDNGKYSNIIGATSSTDCQICPNSLQSKRGSNSIINCTAMCAKGTTGVFGDCSSCEAGKFKDTIGPTECQNCAEKSNSIIGSDKCTCVAGREENVAGNCEICTKGNYKSDFSTFKCSVCANGTNTDVDNDSYNQDDSIWFQACVCDAGYELFDGDCVKCKAGYYKERTGQDSCTSCQSGKFSLIVGGSSASVCENCDVGKYQNQNGKSSCIGCSMGKFAKNINTGSQSELTLCESCPAGKLNTQTGLIGEQACVLCGNGTFSNKIGATTENTCTACSTGKYATETHTICESCVAGTFSETIGAHNIASCQTCVLGKNSFVIGLGNNNECEHCEMGKYGKLDNNNINGCVNCEHGKFTTSKGMTKNSDCLVCSSDNQALPGFGTCTDIICKSGEYKQINTQNINSCEMCPAGTWSSEIGNEGLDTCNKCPAGTFSSEKGRNSSTFCMTCPEGKYSTTKSTGNYESQCTECAIGTYRTSRGGIFESACTPCPTGTYSSVVGLTSQCQQCAYGKFSDSQKSTACSSCFENAFSEEGSVSQSQCECYGLFTKAEDRNICECPDIHQLIFIGDQELCLISDAPVDFIGFSTPEATVDEMKVFVDDTSSTVKDLSVSIKTDFLFNISDTFSFDIITDYMSDFVVSPALKDTFILSKQKDGELYFNVKACSELAANAVKRVTDPQNSQEILKTVQLIPHQKHHQVVDVLVCNLKSNSIVPPQLRRRGLLQTETSTDKIFKFKCNEKTTKECNIQAGISIDSFTDAIITANLQFTGNENQQTQMLSKANALSNEIEQNLKYNSNRNTDSTNQLATHARKSGQMIQTTVSTQSTVQTSNPKLKSENCDNVTQCTSITHSTKVSTIQEIQTESNNLSIPILIAIIVGSFCLCICCLFCVRQMLCPQKYTNAHHPRNHESHHSNSGSRHEKPNDATDNLYSANYNILKQDDVCQNCEENPFQLYYI